MELITCEDKTVVTVSSTQKENKLTIVKIGTLFVSVKHHQLCIFTL